MSLTGVRAYFRTHFNAAGFVEWQDAFNRDDVPNSIINKSYHILTPTITQTQHNQAVLELEETVETTFFIKGYRTPAVAVDDAHTFIQALLRRLLLHANRTQGNLKNLVLDNVDIEAFDESNDNMVRVTMRWRASVMIDVRD